MGEIVVQTSIRYFGRPVKGQECFPDTCGSKPYHSGNAHREGRSMADKKLQIEFSIKCYTQEMPDKKNTQLTVSVEHSLEKPVPELLDTYSVSVPNKMVKETILIFKKRLQDLTLEFCNYSLYSMALTTNDQELKDRIPMFKQKIKELTGKTISKYRKCIGATTEHKKGKGRPGVVPRKIIGEYIWQPNNTDPQEKIPILNVVEEANFQDSFLLEYRRVQEFLRSINEKHNEIYDSTEGTKEDRKNQSIDTVKQWYREWKNIELPDEVIQFLENKKKRDPVDNITNLALARTTEKLNLPIKNRQARELLKEAERREAKY